MRYAAIHVSRLRSLAEPASVVRIGFQHKIVNKMRGRRFRKHGTWSRHKKAHKRIAVSKTTSLQDRYLIIFTSRFGRHIGFPRSSPRRPSTRPDLKYPRHRRDADEMKRRSPLPIPRRKETLLLLDETEYDLTMNIVLMRAQAHHLPVLPSTLHQVSLMSHVPLRRQLASAYCGIPFPKLTRAALARSNDRKPHTSRWHSVHVSLKSHRLVAGGHRLGRAFRDRAVAETPGCCGQLHVTGLAAYNAEVYVRLTARDPMRAEPQTLEMLRAQ